MAGPLLGGLLWTLLPDSYSAVSGELIRLPAAARATGAVATCMAVWWMTEAIPVQVTALLPLVLFPLLGIADIGTTAASYGHEIIFLFMGGFILALALERWGLHKRLALNVLAAVGPRPARIIGAFMAVSALLSMWVTNTATTLMLLPVATSVIRLLPGNDLDDGRADEPFAVCLLLGIAYASSIGGMGTIIGTAPNVFVVSFIGEQLGRRIGFLEWMQFALPLVAVLLPLAWWLLTRWVFPLRVQTFPAAAATLREQREALARPVRGEWLTLAVFLATALAWLTRPLLNGWVIAGVRPLAELTDAGIAITAAVILFLVPTSFSRQQFLMDWQTAVKLPWGLLILFGGGLALAAALGNSGFSAYLGSLAANLAGWPLLSVVLVVTAVVVFLTELTSNTATTATLVPLLLAVALGLGLPPLMLMLPATFAASCAFMLPVATPPNAIVFGSGLLRIGTMSRAGLWLNIAAILVITGFAYAILIPLFGAELRG
ncbi:MAG: DASS family sodium-coupled anion symporter [Gammaproteobacteria bacterium]|jgi:sodium-dependent dicarboxylate transporter 2/3/5|nr:DASS family sodium-coupled anion symporter [Gammaproteobacteria bacterium]